MAPMLPIAKKTNAYEGSNQGILTIVAELASGGYGSVTKCTSHAGIKTYAVKRVCNGPRGAVGELMALHEGLHHNNLLHIEEAFKSGKGEFCLRMRFTAGQELFDLAGTLSCRETLVVAREVGDALRYLHMRGFVHRDCKPENIMVQPSGSCVLIDLGSLRPWGSVAAVEGTLAYMAPEARGQKKQKVLPSLDAWSLGATVSVAILGIAIRNSQEALRYAYRRKAHMGITHAAARLMKKSMDQRDTIASFLSNLHELSV